MNDPKDDMTEGERFSLNHVDPSLADMGIYHSSTSDEAFWMELAYIEADKAKTGSMIHCPACNNKIKKTTYHKKFCNSRCKDRYWNSVDETRMERAKIMNR